MDRDSAEVTPGVRRAALAFSALRRPEAETVGKLLNANERARLRLGLAHVQDATVVDMRVALHALVTETRNGPAWTTPLLHDPNTCPFRCVEKHDAETVVQALDLMAGRRPLHAAVALSHIEEDMRAELFEALPKETRNVVLRHLEEVTTVSLTRSRAIAKDLERLLIARR